MSGDELGKLRRVCAECGAKLTHPEHAGRPRKFCDEDCARDGANRRKRGERSVAGCSCGARFATAKAVHLHAELGGCDRG